MQEEKPSVGGGQVVAHRKEEQGAPQPGRELHGVLQLASDNARQPVARLAAPPPLDQVRQLLALQIASQSGRGRAWGATPSAAGFVLMVSRCAPPGSVLFASRRTAAVRQTGLTEDPLHMRLRPEQRECQSGTLQAPACCKPWGLGLRSQTPRARVLTRHPAVKGSTPAYTQDVLGPFHPGRASLVESRFG